MAISTQMQWGESWWKASHGADSGIGCPALFDSLAGTWAPSEMASSWWALLGIFCIHFVSISWEHPQFWSLSWATSVLLWDWLWPCRRYSPSVGGHLSLAVSWWPGPFSLTSHIILYLQTHFLFYLYLVCPAHQILSSRKSGPRSGEPWLPFPLNSRPFSHPASAPHTKNSHAWLLGCTPLFILCCADMEISVKHGLAHGTLLNKSLSDFWGLQRDGSPPPCTAASCLR